MYNSLHYNVSNADSPQFISMFYFFALHLTVETADEKYIW